MKKSQLLKKALLFGTVWAITMTSVQGIALAAEEADDVIASEKIHSESVKDVENTKKLVDTSSNKELLTDKSWNNEVKEALVDLLLPFNTGERVIKHGKKRGPKLKDIPYAIINLDKSTGIEAAQENILMWQLENLKFAMKPEKFSTVIKTNMTNTMLSSTYGADNGKGAQISILDVMEDVSRDYEILYNDGLVSANKGMLNKAQKESDTYKDFVIKMRWLYSAINATQGADIAKPWASFLNTDMTPYAAYSLIIDGMEYYGDYVDDEAVAKGTKPTKKQLAMMSQRPAEWSDELLKSPWMADSRVSQVSIMTRQGITSTKQVAELVQALQSCGIDVWCVSSANYDLVRAALNYYHVPGMDGMIAMRIKTTKDGVYTNEYDFKKHAAPYGDGKLDAVQAEIIDFYNAKAPLLIAEDRDYFDGANEQPQLSEKYPKTELVITFNDGRATEATKGQTK